MEQLINELYDVIKDHREEENFMTIERISTWIKQFNENDREFILAETLHIFKQRYISKENGRKHVKMMIEYVANIYGLSVTEFINESYFINNQANGKSQNVLLGFLNEILSADYNTSLKDINFTNSKYVVYLDDILCTGETLVHGLTHEEDGWFNLKNASGTTNYDSFIASKSVLILGYLAVHSRCANKLVTRLYKSLGDRNITFRKIWNTDFEIDNDLNTRESSLNFLYPSETVSNDLIKNCKNQIEEKVNDKGLNLSKISFRSPGEPTKEKLFSSNENRNRYEKIILEKSIEYYQYIEDKLRSRPLGYGLNHDVSFGFGTMIFTWRNVPFNTPLIFWYSYNGCTPLFERIYT